MKKFDDVEQLKRFKKEHEWSYQKLAAEIGVHYQTVIAWLTRGVKPSPMARRLVRRFLIDHF